MNSKVWLLPSYALQFPLCFSHFIPSFSIPLLHPFPLLQGCFSSRLSVSHTNVTQQWIRSLQRALKPDSARLQGDPTNTDARWAPPSHSSGTSLSRALWRAPFPPPPLSLPCKLTHVMQAAGGQQWAQGRLAFSHPPGVSDLSWPGNPSCQNWCLCWMWVCDPVWPVRWRDICWGLRFHNKRTLQEEGPLCYPCPYCLPGMLLHKNTLLKVSVIRQGRHGA